jgi:glycosyltransferase involved in cell wall biosynthesis
MKRIVFFTETEWAFGVIHYELTKYLFCYGVSATVMPWNKVYSRLEVAELSDTIDYFISTPYGVAILIDSYGVAPEKCIAVAHARMDIECLMTFLPENRQRLASYGVVSDWLKEQSIALGVERDPVVTPIGINYKSFFNWPSEELRTVGYAGAINPDNVHRHIKRPWLIEQAVTAAGLDLKIAHSYHNSWVTMPGYYKTVDAVVIASTEEGAGLPALEAAAAGKLVISTPVGIWLARAEDSGHTVPIEETQFVRQTVDWLNYYKNSPDKYQIKCIETQQHARRYDWANVIHHWIELIG